MTNVSATKEKLTMRGFLFEQAVRALEKNGWRVERIQGAGKGSIRRITKGSQVKTVTIRTSQDTWIAFPRNATDTGWATLEDADFVVAASVDDRANPQFAKIHVIAADKVRARFDRLYAAKKAAGHTIPIGRGVWLSLYQQESKEPVSLVGAGIGLEEKPHLIAPLPTSTIDEDESDATTEAELTPAVPGDPPLTIIEAKRRLAATFGVKEEDIKITING